MLVDTITAGDVSKIWGTLQIPDQDGTEIQLRSPQTTYRKKSKIQRESPETPDKSAAEIQPVSPLLSKVLTVSPQKTGAEYMEMEPEKENSSPADEDLDEDNVISTTSLNSDRDHVRPVNPGCKFPEKLAESLRIMQEELAQVSSLGNAAGFTDEMNIESVFGSTQRTDENGLKVLTLSPQKTGADYMEMEPEKENSSPADEDLIKNNAISTTSLNPDVDHVRPMSPSCKFPEKLAETPCIAERELAQVSSLGNSAGVIAEEKQKKLSLGRRIRRFFSCKK